MKITVIALFTLVSIFAQAQEVICDTTTCTKKKAGKYLVEVVRKCSDRLSVYVNDSKGKPVLNTTIIGFAEFFFHDNTYVVEDFYQYPQTNFLEAEIPRTGFYDFKIVLVINSQTFEATFDNECTLRAQADY